MEPLARGTPHCFLEGVLEIEAMLDKFGTLGAHGGVLLGAITMRHVNDCAQTRAARDNPSNVVEAGQVATAARNLALCSRNDESDRRG